jgi:hypothetical protein
MANGTAGQITAALAWEDGDSGSIGTFEHYTIEVRRAPADGWEVHYDGKLVDRATTREEAKERAAQRIGAVLMSDVIGSQIG